MAAPDPIPLGLYVHLPWCVRKCPYCDFNSHELTGEIPESAYVGALVADLDAVLPRVWGRRLESVFIGGGTPSLFSAEAIRRLLGEIRARFAPPPDMEVTLEANPGTAEQGRFAGYRAAGVNRLSIGVQSFDDDRLEALGRIHSGGEAGAALAMARAAGFERLNLDLMFGLPGQSIDGAVADVARAIELGPDHISHYQLTLEPGTAFGRRPPVLPAEEDSAAMQEACMERFAAAGYRRYEVSAWAHPGGEASHNLNYWTFGDYLGIGAGAHGKITDPVDGSIRRVQKVRNPRTYVKVAGSERAVEASHKLAPEEVPVEFLMNALRLPDGFSRRLFEARTGLPWTAVAPALAELVVEGLMVETAEGIAPSERGFAFLDEVLVRLAEALEAPGTGCAATAAPTC